MSVTFGFYNSINHDRRYDAVQFGSIFDGVIRDGIYETVGDAFAVKATEGMTLNISEGRAWFNHTWIQNDALYPITWDGDLQPELTLKRIDMVVIEINSDIAVRANSIKVIKGTPASNPVEPELINDDYVHQYPLAAVAIDPQIFEITQANITNYIGTDRCPLATGVFKVLDSDVIISQWRTAYNESLARDHSEYVKIREEDDTSFDTWFANKKEEVLAWFENLQVTMDDNVAMHLQNQIDRIIPISNEELKEILEG